MKQCHKCEEEKDESEFSKCKASKDGLQYCCKKCHSKYYEENKERRTAYKKTYYINNKEKILSYNKNYHINNKEKRYNYNKNYNKNHPGYRSYNNMMQRCNNPKDIRYSRYGGRGIKVCERWKEGGYKAFIEDIGLPPEDMKQPTIDRIDNDGDYCPDNCQWLERSENTKKAWRDR